jgi:hypothetical protein
MIIVVQLAADGLGVLDSCGLRCVQRGWISRSGSRRCRYKEQRQRCSAKLMTGMLAVHWVLSFMDHSAKHLCGARAPTPGALKRYPETAAAASAKSRRCPAASSAALADIRIVSSLEIVALAAAAV